jgi:predicted  nucleic acid-binding Zn-ribbon protein
MSLLVLKEFLKHEYVDLQMLIEKFVREKEACNERCEKARKIAGDTRNQIWCLPEDDDELSKLEAEVKEAEGVAAYHSNDAKMWAYHIHKRRLALIDMEDHLLKDFNVVVGERVWY